MHSATPMVAWGLIHGMLANGWTRSSLCLSRLDRGFLIRADDPDPLFKQGRGVFIQLQHGASTQKERFSILDMLPGMVAPRTNLLGFEPAAKGAGRDGRQGRGRSYVSSQFGSTPMSQRYPMRAGQAARQGRHLRSHLRGETTGRSRSGGVLERMGLRPASSPLPNETSFEAKRLSQLL